jgi:hypothetical protein
MYKFEKYLKDGGNIYNFSKLGVAANLKIYRTYKIKNIFQFNAKFKVCDEKKGWF